MVDNLTETPHGQAPTERQPIHLNGYIQDGLPAVRAVDQSLADRITQTNKGDSHLFNEEELQELRRALLDEPVNARSNKSNLLSGYADARWAENRAWHVSAFRQDNNKPREKPYQESTAAMFWYLFKGSTPEERDMERLRFYMNLSRKEAEAYANEKLVPSGESYTYTIEPRY